MIKLYQFYGCWNLPSASPFCVKLETYLRMTGIPYEISRLQDPRKTPKGKLPYVEYKGEKIGDSSLVIERLKAEFGDVLDQHLTSEQKATSLAFQRLLEEHLYWVIAYTRWVEKENWAKTKVAYFGGMPPLIRKFVPEMIRKNVVKNIHEQGVGRHTQEEIYKMGCDDLDALSVLLGEKEYFFNNKPSSLDAIAYAFTTGVLYPPLPSRLKTHAATISNLKQHVDRIEERYYKNKSGTVKAQSTAAAI
ncbi:MAG: glutathione S-transferase family protein [Gammaproteobacteria bacterium]|nr:glutathione S-transferase family protein [Gammaproteobacteria bacterium]MCH9743533.1 glutathione S-transferase family protein [Gammaproteobacteria bacterium]